VRGLLFFCRAAAAALSAREHDSCFLAQSFGSAIAHATRLEALDLSLNAGGSDILYSTIRELRPWVLAAGGGGEGRRGRLDALRLLDMAGSDTVWWTDGFFDELVPNLESLCLGRQTILSWDNKVFYFFAFVLSKSFAWALRQLAAAHRRCGSKRLSGG
jgi:hypothetical protein